MEYFTWIVLTLVSLVVTYYWHATKRFQYWSSRGVDGPKPQFIFGNLLTRMTKTIDQYELEWSKQYGKLYGVYAGMVPNLTILDHELIKQIMVKDFHLFVNRRKQNFYHEIMSLNLFSLHGEKWKRVRSITSPTFSTGKLKSMHRMMNQCVDKFHQYLHKVTDPKHSEKGVINIKDVISGFTIDVIASTSFATETNANDDRTDSKNNPLLVQAKKFFQFNKFKVACIFVFPLWLNTFLGIRSGNPNESMEYFVGLTKQIVSRRMSDKQSKQKRNDLVQLLLDASVDESELSSKDYSRLTATADDDTTNKDHQESSKMEQNGNMSSGQRKLNENEIIAQCIVFFVAGFETTATTLTHLIYELAVNQDIQQRLLDDILEHVGNQNQDSDEFYDKVMTKIPLIDAVIKETLRKYPPVSRLERRVSVDGYQLGGVKLYKDQLVEVPVYAVHHSEEYYPEPERFNPDRFMPENKHLLVPYTYMPFGQGPRNCVGMRFAYQEIKLFIAQILPRYRFETTPETSIPLKFKKSPVLLNPGDVPIKVSRR